ARTARPPQWPPAIWDGTAAAMLPPPVEAEMRAGSRPPLQADPIEICAGPSMRSHAARDAAIEEGYECNQTGGEHGGGDQCRPKLHGLSIIRARQQPGPDAGFRPGRQFRNDRPDQ